MSDNNAPIPNLDTATSDAHTAKLPSVLNAIVLPLILSRTDAETVCRFSRTCRWAKEFVDANIRRLPQAEFVRAKITVNQFSVIYCLVTCTGHKLEVEKRCFGLEPILKWASYGSLKDFHLVCGSIAPQHFKTVLEAVLNAGITLSLVEWKTSKGSFRASSSVYDCKKSFSSYLRNLLSQPLEVIFSSDVSVENDCGIHEILAMAVQFMVVVKVGLLGAARTKSECLLFLAKMIKALGDGSNGICTPDLFPSITLCVKRNLPFQFSKFAGEDRDLFLVYLMDHGLTPRYSISNDSSLRELEINCEDQTWRVCAELSIDYDYSCAIDELRVECKEHRTELVHRLQRVIDCPEAVAATLEQFKKNSYAFLEDGTVDVILEAMRRFKKNYRVIAAGLDVLSDLSIFKMFPIHAWPHTTDKLKRSISTMLLDLMEAQVLEEEIVGSCCCMLLNLRFPADYEFDFAVQIMINVFTKNQHIALKEGHCLSLLNKLVDRMTVQQKKQIGKTGVIEDSLQLIESLSEELCHEDDELSRLFYFALKRLRRLLSLGEFSDIGIAECWNFLFHVTDGTLENILRFVKAEGAVLLWKCYWKLEGDSSMTESILGVMRNIREGLHDAGTNRVLRSIQIIPWSSECKQKNLSTALKEAIAYRGNDLYKRAYNAGVIAALQNCETDDISKRMKKLSKTGKTLSSTAFKKFLAYQGKKKIFQQKGKRRMYR